MARKPAALAACCALLLGGCATITALTRVDITLPPPPPEARAALAPVTGIAIEPPSWGALPATPWAKGAASVTGGGMLASMQSGCVGAVVSPSTLLAPWFVPFTCAGASATGSVGAVATGATAAGQARTPEQVEEARAAFGAAVAAIKPAGDLGDQLLARSDRDGVPMLLACPAEAGCTTDDGTAPSAYLRLAVLPEFASKGAFNPEVTLFLTDASVTLLPEGRAGEALPRDELSRTDWPPSDRAAAYIDVPMSARPQSRQRSPRRVRCCRQGRSAISGEIPMRSWPQPSQRWRSQRNWPASPCGAPSGFWLSSS
jgi:hypothetical protein